jgi:NADH-quinone oxidoreductase subunit E
MLLETHAAEIETILAKYAQKRSAVLPLLYIAQDEYGHLTKDAIREVASILDLPYTDVFEIVGFYTLFYNRPMGRWVLQVCDDVPCCYLGAEEVISGLKRRLGIEEEQTTPDGMFTLQRVKCVAACNKAPVLQANLNYIYNLSDDKLDALLRDLRAQAESGQKLSISGRLAEDYDATPEGLRQIVRDLGSISQEVAAIEAQVASETAKTESEAPAAESDAEKSE